MRTVIRRSIALLSVVTLMLGVSALRSPTAFAATCNVATTSTNDVVQICITAPNAGATLSGTTPAAGQPEIVGAVGSGADGAAGSNSVATQVRGWSPNLFLFLGDVYEMGTYEEFQNWYDPSWGPMRGVTNPVPGDQEVFYGVG